MLVSINSTWQNLNTLTGIAAGSAVFIQSRSPMSVFAIQQDTAPSSDSLDGKVMQLYESWQITSGSKATWVKTLHSTGSLYVEVS